MGKFGFWIVCAREGQGQSPPKLYVFKPRYLTLLTKMWFYVDRFWVKMMILHLLVMFRKALSIDVCLHLNSFSSIKSLLRHLYDTKSISEAVCFDGLNHGIIFAWIFVNIRFCEYWWGWYFTATAHLGALALLSAMVLTQNFASQSNVLYQYGWYIMAKCQGNDIYIYKYIYIYDYVMASHTLIFCDRNI